MKLYVKKQPGQDPVAICRELPDDVPGPEGFENITVSEYEAWLAQQPLQPVQTPIPVPESVTRRQLKEWLIDHDLYDTVFAILNAKEPPKYRKKALNWWSEATDFRRDHPLVAQLAAALSMTTAQTDQAFREAALL